MSGAGVQRMAKGPCYLLLGKSLRLRGQHLLNAAERQEQVLVTGMCKANKAPHNLPHRAYSLISLEHPFAFRIKHFECIENGLLGVCP